MKCIKDSHTIQRETPGCSLMKLFKIVAKTYLSIDIIKMLYVEATYMHHKGQRVFQSTQWISPRKPNSTLYEL